MQVLSFSERGRRADNEDYVLSEVYDETASMHIVTDGMGGYTHGALAAKEVANAVARYCREQVATDVNVESLIVQAVNYGNIIIREISEECKSQMGTTIAGVLLIDRKAYLYWVGDTRIYHFSNQKVIFISTDHSYVNQLRDSGCVITQGIQHQYGHLVTRSIMGLPEGVKVQLEIIDNVPEGDIFLICTDGVHVVIPSCELEEIIRKTSQLSVMVETIKNRCQMEGYDNYSGILILL
jgi:protein phosphatase